MDEQLTLHYKKQGRFFKVNSTNGFVFEKGEGTSVVCFHGVPSSSFLYRKVIDGLSENGFKGIAFDLLGMETFRSS